MDIRALRSRVEKAHRNATSKVSRLNRSGIAMSGSEFDVRRDLGRVRRYNKKQLESYLSELNRFNRRTVRFVGVGPDKQPVPEYEWKRYKRIEAGYNDTRQKYLSRIKDNVFAGSTVEQRIEMRRLVNPRMHDSAQNMNWDGLSRRPEDIRGRAALHKLEASIRRNSGPQHLRRESIKGRRIAYDMLNFIGNERMSEKIEDLTDDEWEELWLTPGMAHHLSEWYEHAKYSSRDGIGERDRHGTEQMMMDAQSNVEELIDDIMARRG